jgi:hypothetical protein
VGLVRHRWCRGDRLGITAFARGRCRLKKAPAQLHWQRRRCRRAEGTSCGCGTSDGMRGGHLRPRCSAVGRLRVVVGAVDKMRLLPFPYQCLLLCPLPRVLGVAAPGMTLDRDESCISILSPSSRCNGMDQVPPQRTS